MYGVSPAYFISACSDRFTPAQVAEALVSLREMGFTGYQLEVFHPQTLDEWVHGGARRVVETGRKLGLKPTQFVAHFLLHGFSGPEAVCGAFGVAETEQIMLLLEDAPECSLVTVPLPEFVAGSETGAGASPPAGRGAQKPGAGYARVFRACVDKLRRMLATIENAGRRMALEILPGALVSGSDGFLRLQAAVGGSLGYNLDTGHAWAQKEPVEYLPEKLAGCILGTHLCDNSAGVNESLRPGKGTIPWGRTVSALLRSGYHGSLDLEIKCESDAVAAEYERGLAYLKELVTENAHDQA